MTFKVPSSRITFYSTTEDLNAFDMVATDRRISRSDLLRESMLNTIMNHNQIKGKV